MIKKLKMVLYFKIFYVSVQIHIVEKETGA